jgi:two-component system NtrC family sensor kinase
MRLSIATKVFLGFVAVLLTSGSVSVYGIVRLHRIGLGLSLVHRYSPLVLATGSLEGFQKERERNTERLLAETAPAARRGLVDRTYFPRGAADLLATERRLIDEARAGLTDSERAALDRIAARLGQVGLRIDDEEKEAAALAASLTAPPPELVARLKTAERRVDHEIKTLGQVLQEQMDQGVAEAERQEIAARWAVLALSTLALAIGLFVTFLSQRALRPIRRLTEAAQRLGRGSPETVAVQQVPDDGVDELAVLAREFNAMAQRLALRERELKAQGEALLRSERLAAIGRIAAQITHEIRNPLSSISLNAEELGERLRDGPQAALCDAIVREVDRLAAVTEEYLRFARLPKPQPVRADVNEAVRDLLDFVRPELKAGGVQLEQQLAEAIPEVLGDVGQLRQLLLNLVRNAREAMPGGGGLRVSTSLTAGFVAIAVQDAGPGIPPERLQRIFDPFFTTKERGTGLGLALAQEIAQEHGGQLTCQSAPGKGTTFTLRLPAAPALREEPLPEGPALRAIAPA